MNVSWSFNIKDSFLSNLFGIISLGKDIWNYETSSNTELINFFCLSRINLIEVEGSAFGFRFGFVNTRHVIVSVDGRQQILILLDETAITTEKKDGSNKEENEM